jgi:hypothetical protein
MLASLTSMMQQGIRESRDAVNQYVSSTTTTMWVITLETVKDNTVVEANLLVHKEGLHIRSLVPRKLNDFTRILVLLDGSVARKILLEGLANSLDIQIVG